MLITKATIAFVIIVMFCIGFLGGAVWYSLGKKKHEVEPFDESEIYNPKLKIVKREKARH